MSSSKSASLRVKSPMAPAPTRLPAALQWLLGRLGSVLGSPFRLLLAVRKFASRNRLLAALSAFALAWLYWQRVQRRERGRREKLLDSGQERLRSGAEALAKLRTLGLRRGAFAKLSQGRTHYVLVGERSAPLVVLFHGFGVFSFVWEGLYETFLENGYQVLAFDFYGFGFSDAPDTTFNVELFCQQARELVRALDLPRRFTLVGHSMGGLLASEFSCRYPSAVDRLVLICPAGTPVEGHDSLYVKLIQLATKLATAPLVGRLVVNMAVDLMKVQTEASLGLSGSRNLSFGTLLQSSKGLARVSSRLELRQAGGRFVNMVDMTTKALYFQAKHNPNFARSITETLGNLDLFGDWRPTFAALGTHTRPTLIMWGTADEYIPYANMNTHLLPLMPHAETEVFEDADHFVFFNEPVQFRKALFGFLSRTRAESARPRTPPKYLPTNCKPGNRKGIAVNGERSPVKTLT